MLTIVEIDRFRSLSKVRLQLREGLNVLVGPNGSGKTNVLAALDFLSHLANGSPADAVTRMGGASGVFQRSPDGHSPSCRFSVGGTFVVRHPKHEQRRYSYRYAFSLQQIKDGVRLRNQSLHIDLLKSPKLAARRILRVKQLGGGETLKVLRFDDARGLETVFLEKKKLTAKELQRLLLDFPFAEAECLLPRLEFALRIVHLVRRDLTHAERLRVRPDIIRDGDTNLGEARIGPSGAGAVRLLHALQSNTWASKAICRPIVSRLNEELRLAVSSMEGFDTQLDSFADKLRLVFKVRQGEAVVEVPAPFVSDGTLKWLVTTAAVLTSNLFSVEEPENFLHPWMQQELVKLLRERKVPVLLTTHSETLLNCLQPEEVVVVRMVEGLSRTNRVANAEELREEIAATGFGLGHFLVAGAVDDGMES